MYERGEEFNIRSVVFLQRKMFGEPEKVLISKNIENKCDPLISIVMPVYNSEKYLADTISSIQDQTYDNWELLAVDDCSADDSYNILCDYAYSDSRIKILRLEKNNGPAYARNKGIENCSGKYLTFIDSDDLWHRDKLEKELRFIMENDYLFVYTAYDLIKENGEKTGLVVPVLKKIDYHKLLYNNIISTITVMIDLEKVGKFMMPDCLGEDLATWLMLVKRTTYAYGLNEILASYRQVPSSISHNFKSRMSRTWIVYRKVEHLSFCKSTYLYVRHMFCMLTKRKTACRD